MNNFDLRKFLSENKLTPTSKIIKEEADRYDGKLPKILSLISNLKSNITNRPPKTFVRDGLLFVSAEDGNNFADYYPEMSDDPYIDPRLEKMADAYNTYWDWEDAGSIVLSPLSDLDENIMDEGNSDSTDSRNINERRTYDQSIDLITNKLQEIWNSGKAKDSIDLEEIAVDIYSAFGAGAISFNAYKYVKYSDDADDEKIKEVKPLMEIIALIIEQIKKVFNMGRRDDPMNLKEIAIAIFKIANSEG